MEIEIRRTETPRTPPAPGELGFGRVFSDHMFVADWTDGRGWHDARVVPYAPFELDPAAAVFHYGQAMFEGLKAFRGQDGQVRLFRVDRHARRMHDGASRLCMPPMEAEDLVAAIRAVVKADAAWVPGAPGTALYIRPTLIATEPFLGVRPSRRYALFVILSPVGAYYPEGINPVKIWVEQRYVRAARGGLGAVKAGANYASSLRAALDAQKLGYAQVLWLDASEHRWCEEMGVMNLFVRIGDRVITPPLEGTILDGVTRASVLDLLAEWGVPHSERRLSIDEVVDAHRDGSLAEVWGCGTAAVISPVGELCWQGEKLKIADGAMGPLARRLYDTITGVQYGGADTRGWMTAV